MANGGELVAFVDEGWGLLSWEFYKKNRQENVTNESNHIIFCIPRMYFAHMCNARHARGTSCGIAVDSDLYAKEFQRYQHLANLLETKLEKILREVDQQRWKEQPEKFAKMFPSALPCA